MTKIPLYKPFIYEKEELEAVKRVFKSNILEKGQETINFEKEFAQFTGKKFAIAVSNGTAALHLGIKALDWSKGDEIITTPFSYIATSNALLYENIKPIFADIDPITFNLDPQKVKTKINKKTKGILLVHIFGQAADSDAFRKLSSKYNLDILEDACEALGKPDLFFPVGQISKVSVYGFCSNKQITSAGSGGMLVTDDKTIAQLCNSMRDHGRSNSRDWLNKVILGYNYKITEIQAAIGRVQLKRISYMNKMKENIAEKYNLLLKTIPNIVVPAQIKNLKRSWFCYFIQFKSKELREAVFLKLSRNNIESHKYFTSIHLYPMYKKFGYKKGDYPISEHASDTILALPFYIGLKNCQMGKIVSIIKKTVNNFKN